MLRLALTPRWLSFLALVLVLASIFVGLSMWQVDRAQHKNDVLTAQDVDTMRPFNDVLDAQVPMPQRLVDQRVSLSGRYLPDAEVLVTDRIHEGDSGFWVVTMFEVAGAQLGEEAQLSSPDTATAKPIAIPVIRGWVADAASAADHPAPAGDIDMEARLGPVEGPLQASDLPDGQVRSVSTSQLINMFDVHTYSGVLFPEHASMTGAGDGMPHVDLEAQEDGKGVDWQSAIYALEWIFFAGFAFYIWFQLLRDAHRAQQQEEFGGPTEYVIVKQAGAKDLQSRGSQTGDTQTSDTQSGRTDTRRTDAGDTDTSSTRNTHAGGTPQ